MAICAVKKRPVILILALSLLAAACSGNDGAGGPTTSIAADTTTSSAAGADPAVYCAALETMLASQPAGGFVGDGFGDAMNAYATTIEAAAELAPGDQLEALDDLADFVRDSAVDPTDEGLAERAFALVGPMLRVQNYASNECGLDVEALAGRGGGGNDDRPLPLRSDVTEIDAEILAAINGLVPAGVDLTFASFTTTDDEEYPVLTAAPVGWDTSDFIGTSFEPGQELGFFTQMEVGAHCDGICAPRDWGSLMDDADFGPFSGLADATEILRDEALLEPMGRLVAYRQDTTITPVEVVVTRWDDRADRYFRCKARLDEDDADLWEAFAAACAASIPLWIPAE